MLSTSTPENEFEFRKGKLLHLWFKKKKPQQNQNL